MLGLFRVLTAFLYGVLLGVIWECASMGVLLAATLVEHLSGTLPMAVIFLGLASCGFVIAARADLGRPLLSILAFRLTAQIAMTIGTGSVRRHRASRPLARTGSAVPWLSSHARVARAWEQSGSCVTTDASMVAAARRRPQSFLVSPR